MSSIAFPFDLFIVISPVEYIKGLPAPSVDKELTFPSPLSVAKVAQETPVEEISKFFPIIVPPKVEWSPLAEPKPVDIIFVPDIIIFSLFVSQTAFAPFAEVEIVLSVIVVSPPWTKTAAFTP